LFDISDEEDGLDSADEDGLQEDVLPEDLLVVAVLRGQCFPLEQLVQDAEGEQTRLLPIQLLQTLECLVVVTLSTLLLNQRVKSTLQTVVQLIWHEGGYLLGLFAILVVDKVVCDLRYIEGGIDSNPGDTGPEPALELHHHGERSGGNGGLDWVGWVRHEVRKGDFVELLAEGHVLYLRLVVVQVAESLACGQLYLTLLWFLGSLGNISIHGSLSGEGRELNGGLEFIIRANEVSLIEFIWSEFLGVVLVQFAHIRLQMFGVEDPM
jgi:hypothetical protein